jgi:hypothetical protein
VVGPCTEKDLAGIFVGMVGSPLTPGYFFWHHLRLVAFCGNAVQQIQILTERRGVRPCTI